MWAVVCVRLPVLPLETPTDAHAVPGAEVGDWFLAGDQTGPIPSCATVARLSVISSQRSPRGKHGKTSFSQEGATTLAANPAPVAQPRGGPQWVRAKGD